MQADTVIIGLAFDESNPEVKKALHTPGVKAYWYNEFLGELLRHYRSISVAGTHGKTTTTGMLAHVLSACITDRVSDRGRSWRDAEGRREFRAGIL